MSLLILKRLGMITGIIAGFGTAALVGYNGYVEIRDFASLADHGKAVTATGELISGAIRLDTRTRGTVAYRRFALHYDGHTKTYYGRFPVKIGAPLKVVYLPEKPSVVAFGNDESSLGELLWMSIGAFGMRAFNCTMLIVLGVISTCLLSEAFSKRRKNQPLDRQES